MKAKRRSGCASLRRAPGWFLRLPFAEARELTRGLYALECEARRRLGIAEPWMHGPRTPEGEKWLPLLYMGVRRALLARMVRLRWVRLSATGKSLALTLRGARAVLAMSHAVAAAEAAGQAAHEAAAQGAWELLRPVPPSNPPSLLQKDRP